MSSPAFPAVRYTLQESDPHSEREDFATAVARGLDGDPKSLPCRFFYDAEGSQLFEEICELPEYYLTRAERQILVRHADQIVASVEAPLLLAELGSGSSAKTRLLIEACLRRQATLTYVPVDISRDMLDASAQALLADYPGLAVHAVAGEYQSGLEALRGASSSPKLIAWLGSNIGNFGRADAADFLAGVRDALAPRDRLLVGVDLRKSRELLEAAYDDAAGTTARFNLNLLARINRELGGRFALEQFAHRARWRAREGRVEISLVSLCDQEVEIAALDRAVKLRQGEAIHTEDSFKYSPAEIEAVARAAGLRVVRRWLDDQGAYSLNLLAAA
jgi:L-histidine N-alpha-methyltransferase